MAPSPPPGIAVSTTGLSKIFRIPHERIHTLKERALHPLRGRSYEQLDALKDVSFEVETGAFFGVVGRNGSGKSTLMKCLAGIYRPDAGEIWARGRMATFIELGVGFNPDLAARDNVEVNAIMLGLDPTQARERYDEIIDFAELREFADLKLKNYSSGMHVRLAFSVMMHVDADLLLIDEVLAVGDAAFQQKCHDALQELRDEGRTIMLVTHDMNAVQRFCDRALLLEHGVLTDIGEPRQIARRYHQVNFSAGDGQPAGTAHVGDGAAAIVDTWFEDEDGRRSDSLLHDTPCAVCMLVEFRAEASDPGFGVVLTDERHQVVTADSSAYGGGRSGHFEASDVVEIRFRFHNVLTGGRYYASPEVAHRGHGHRLMDHRENAATAVVNGGRGSIGVLDLPRDLEIKKRVRA
jgi:ABC-type polysaccharide/polyol phosphate transport system ATPase subunit